ncbi:MAG: D-2-hydroxyacid dehydrogenase [Gammaproteobacteria bacterium]|nr:D-2-hydroxyacid dehydrogenase [Gammaproteobacteria bacterium]MDD9896632.1 D-2-hydroxyacid dehydrogenase [Gammaproteobacteria bacterium]MDD9958050.1 D-2-hydroxyacid dehydrogenase [Gammaproteobacteria bacterium]
MAKLSFFIAAHNGAEYPGLIKHRLGKDISYSVATTIEDGVAQYDGQPVLLARPDFAAAILNCKPPIKWIQSTWAGVAPLINHPARDYVLTGVKDVFGAQMTEYVIGHILHHELRIGEREQQQLQKLWKARGSGRLEGKTMGVLGTGSIAIDLANTVSRLGVKVIGYNSSGKHVEPFEQIFTRNSLTQFLQQSDYLIGILPDLPGTTNLLDASAFNSMKESALLINVGRGNLIDDDALCAALASNQIAGAILDVFKQEPLPEQSPLWTAKNLKITPHIAAMSYPKDITEVFLRNLERYLNDEELLYQIDFTKGY